MSSDRKPIYSFHEDEPELQEAIDDFVIALAERLDTLQDLHSVGSLPQLGESCGELAREAQRLGYPLLASVARATSAACQDGKADASEEGLIEMTELTQRIRQAHRGAA